MKKGAAARSERMPKARVISPHDEGKGEAIMSDATGVNNISGGSLDEEAKKKTGKTMEELTDEKRKELDKKVEQGGDENIKIRTNQILP
ncbi:hypothetical protein [Nitrobacter winogradskyi]|nr:hypothetical protein [Nitrobacter winogradskyi]